MHITEHNQVLCPMYTFFYACQASFFKWNMLLCILSQLCILVTLRSMQQNDFKMCHPITFYVSLYTNLESCSKIANSPEFQNNLPNDRKELKFPDFFSNKLKLPIILCDLFCSPILPTY